MQPTQFQHLKNCFSSLLSDMKFMNSINPKKGLTIELSLAKDRCGQPSGLTPKAKLHTNYRTIEKIYKFGCSVYCQ